MKNVRVIYDVIDSPSVITKSIELEVAAVILDHLSRPYTYPEPLKYRDRIAEIVRNLEILKGGNSWLRIEIKEINPL